MHKWTLIAVIGLKWGLHPHHLKDQGVQSLPELHLRVPALSLFLGFLDPPWTWPVTLTGLLVPG